MATKVVLPAWRLEQLRAAAVNTAESQDSVNKPPELTQKKKDRHRPGYMAEYMRQYRGKRCSRKALGPATSPCGRACVAEV